jgi:hypothetical protein
MPRTGSRVLLGESHRQIRVHSLHLRVRLLSRRLRAEEDVEVCREAIDSIIIECYGRKVVVAR